MIELQKIDTNCNDCKHFERSLSKRQEHVDFHYKMQKNLFDIKRKKKLLKGEKYLKRANNEPERADEFKAKAKLSFTDARKMNFVFSENSCSLSFGKCIAKNKNISFISGIMMEENFQCFTHRKE